MPTHRISPPTRPWHFSENAEELSPSPFQQLVDGLEGFMFLKPAQSFSDV